MRPLNRLLSALLGLALLLGGLLVAVEVVVALLFDRRPWLLPYDRWLRWARDHEWATDGLRDAAIALIAVGAVLLLLQLLKRRPTALPLAERRPGVQAFVARRSVASALTHEIERLDGVSDATVRAGDRRLRVRAGTNRRVTTGLGEHVHATLDRALGRIQLATPPQVDLAIDRHREG